MVWWRANSGEDINGVMGEIPLVGLGLVCIFLIYPYHSHSSFFFFFFSLFIIYITFARKD